MTDEYGMRDSDFTSHDRPNVASQLPKHLLGTFERCNPILVRSHLQDALQAGASGEVLRAIVRAIKEIER